MRRVGLFLCAGLLLSGCDDETTSPAVDGVTFSGVINQAILGTPIEDANVCVVEPDLGCATSGQAGAYELTGIPKNRTIKVRVSSDGFATALALFIVEEADRTVDGFLFSQSLLDAAYTDAGITYDSSLGAIGFVAEDPNREGGARGYTGTISPSAGDGPYYADATSIDPSATASGDSGGIAFINLPAGDYTVSVDGPSPCTGDGLFEVNADGTWPAPVEDAVITYVYGQCEDAGGGAGGAGGGGGGSGGAGGQ